MYGFGSNYEAEMASKQVYFVYITTITAADAAAPFIIIIISIIINHLYA
jgi:hypothetical protein